MGNSQGNQKGTAQDKREHANQVRKDNPKDTSTTPKPEPLPRGKGGTDPGVRRRGASEPA